MPKLMRRCGLRICICQCPCISRKQNGFAHWMKKQAAEELEHAHKLIDYALDRGGDITIGQINVVPTGWGNPLEVFEHVYKHECYVSELIDKLVDIAEADKDHASRDFLFWFFSNQINDI